MARYGQEGICTSEAKGWTACQPARLNTDTSAEFVGTRSAVDLVALTDRLARRSDSQLIRASLTQQPDGAERRTATTWPASQVTEGERRLRALAIYIYARSFINSDAPREHVCTSV